MTVVMLILHVLMMITTDLVRVKADIDPVKFRNLQLHAAARQLPKAGIGALMTVGKETISEVGALQTSFWTLVVIS